MSDIIKYNEVKAFAEANNAQLIAVSKTRTHEEILEIYDQGHRVFGENRVQELVAKQAALPQDIKWHLIGSLQKNKVKYIAEFIDTIHACDSFELLRIINRQAEKHNRIIKVLLQIKISNEVSKHGFQIQDCTQMLEKGLWKEFANIEIMGLMGMASFVDDNVQLTAEFDSLHALYNEYRSTFFLEKASFKELSMGMSGDYEIAINSGSTMIRVGSLIFGQRQY